MQIAQLPSPPPSPALPPRRPVIHGGLPPWQIKRVTDYIDANLGAILGLSVSHFTRAFKHSVGVPPRVDVTRHRLAACEAMATSATSPTTIAHAHGFCDQSHFTRIFHDVFKLSRHVWRCRHARSEEPIPCLKVGIVEAA